MKVCKDMQKHDFLYQRGLQIKLIHIFLLDFFFFKILRKIRIEAVELSIFSKKGTVRRN